MAFCELVGIRGGEECKRQSATWERSGLGLEYLLESCCWPINVRGVRSGC